MARVEGGFCGLSYWSFSLSLFLSQKQNTAFSPTLALLNISQTRFPFFWHVCGFLLRTDLYEVKCDGNTKKRSLSFREIQLRHISRQKWGSCEEESNKRRHRGRRVFVHVSSRSWAKAHQIEIRVTCDLNAHWQRNRMRKTNFNMFFLTPNSDSELQYLRYFVTVLTHVMSVFHVPTSCICISSSASEHF